VRGKSTDMSGATPAFPSLDVGKAVATGTLKTHTFIAIIELIRRLQWYLAE
jgi:hypothetical protein